MKKLIKNVIQKIKMDNERQRLFKAGASKKRQVDPLAQNPFINI